MPFINFNGNIVDALQPVLTARNRAFRYGDALFETMRLMRGEILYFNKHIERLKHSIKVMQMEWPPDLSLQQLHLLIRHLEQVNELKGNGRIRLEIFRNDGLQETPGAGGNYVPETNSVSFLIEIERLEPNNYLLNETGLKVEIYTEMTKPLNKLSNLKTSNALLPVMAGLYRKNHHIDDCIVLNTENNVAEAISSNIFIVVKEQLFTPSLQQGCVSGVMRDAVIEFMNNRKRKVTEGKITIEQLLAADEVFLTNVISGIRWVAAIRNKRYFNKFSKWLAEERQ